MDNEVSRHSETHHINLSYIHKRCLNGYVETTHTIAVSCLRNVAILVIDKQEGEQLLKKPPVLSVLESRRRFKKLSCLTLCTYTNQEV